MRRDDDLEDALHAAAATARDEGYFEVADQLQVLLGELSTMTISEKMAIPPRHHQPGPAKA